MMRLKYYSYYVYLGNACRVLFMLAHRHSENIYLKKYSYFITDFLFYDFG